MKKIILTVGLLTTATCALQAQTVNDIFNSLFGGGKGKQQQQQSGSLTNMANSEIVGALRDALTIGAQNASGRLSVANGYFGNALVKILLPPEATKVERTLRDLGMGNMVDDLVLRMNRSAEDAATKAAPIFINAIRTMTIQDGINIVRGGNGAATKYLQQRTTSQLTAAFRPVIDNALSRGNVGPLWNKVFSTYNKIPLVGARVNPDLSGYVTERALNGLFVTIADEENKIRLNPAARTTDLLKKVFGAR